jgi:hypothetical protein
MGHRGAAMSALGQKQTFAPQQIMSALPPKADIDAMLEADTRASRRNVTPICLCPIATYL